MGTTINPIIPGFAPDPSVVLVDGTYYLVNSTFHLFPGLPIYTSQDLIHWHQIGNAINRAGQLSFSNASTLIHDLGKGDHLYATGGLYAPTIRYHNGTFYIVCTNVVNPSDRGKSKLENFIISSTDIHASKWSDPVPFQFYGIDPSLFFDPVLGKTYMCGSKSPGPSTKITLFEIDVATGEKLSPEKELWHGTGGIYPEGPHIYHREGFYYLMIAEGGTHEGHSVTMARSKSLDGPWEASPRNPILSAAGTDEYVQCTGHCEAFEGKNGEWYGVCLAIRMHAPNMYGLGRETFLTRGHWDSENWLSFDRVKTQPSNIDTTLDPTRKLTAALGVDWLYIHDPVASNYNISTSTPPSGDKTLSLKPSPYTLSSANASPTFLGKRQRNLKGKSRITHLTSASSPKDLTAGLSIYKDEHRFFYIAVHRQTERQAVIVVRVVNKAQGIDKVEERGLEQEDVEGNEIVFEIKYTEDAYTLLYSVGGGEREMVEVCKVQAGEMSDKDFVGPIVGLFAVSGEEEEGKVVFWGLEVDGDGV
ncbi:hypothetical protein HRS9139_05363 [Pyrenophora teres f. teres]|nr:hypothetical protein HRS9139_05363 [Pyrenophora teres f. teres]